MRDIDVNPTALEYFVRVADFGSISRTALELGIEQSTLTRHIARLESDLKVRLFHRSGRGVMLTDAGALLLTRARAVADAMDDARRLAVSIADRGPGRLVIAAQHTVAQRSFPAIARAMRCRFPETRLQLIEALGHQVISWLVEGKIDVALLYVPVQASVVDVDVLLREPVCFVAPPGVPALGPTISVADMLERPLILPSTPHGVRELAESLAASRGTRLRVEMECDSSNAITKNLVQAGIGGTIMPFASVADEVERGLLQAARIVDPVVTREIAIATARNRPPVIGQWDILQSIRQVIMEQVAQGNWPGVVEYAGQAPVTPS